MSGKFKLGLVVGKFAPLHRGHLHLIEQAAAQSERLLLLSWCEPEPPQCDAAARLRWLQACCPQHEAVVLDNAALARACEARGLVPRELPADTSNDATQQSFLAWLVADLLQCRPDAMFASEPYVEPTAALLGQHLGTAVTPVQVDIARIAVPVSASQIRKHPAGWRRFVPDAVWADWVPRICLLGGESSGKSSLAAALAARFGTEHVAEYGRELWERQGGRLCEGDLLRIAQEQQRREREAASRVERLLVCDTSALTTLFYAQAMFGRTTPELVRLAERPYFLHVLCEPDFAFVQDGTRQNAAFRQRQHAWYLRELAVRGLPSLRVKGSLEQRVAQVERALAASLGSPHSR